jgi:hypothetical protein
LIALGDIQIDADGFQSLTGLNESLAQGSLIAHHQDCTKALVNTIKVGSLNHEMLLFNLFHAWFS